MAGRIAQTNIGVRAAAIGFLFLGTLVAQQRDLGVERINVLPSAEKRWALLVGVDQYEDEQISPLHGAANDAAALKRVMVEYCGFPEGNVVVLASDQPDVRKPKRGNILQRLDNILRLVPKDGLFLFAFSGHGVEWENRAYLMPADAHLASSRRLLEDVALDVQRVRTAIEERGIQQVLVLLDSCRNDPGGRADAANPMRQSFINGLTFNIRNRDVRAFAVLYATSIGDRSWEYTEKRQGYFTWFITEGLKGRAANERGEVTLQSLVSYVEDQVPRQVALDLGEKGRQRPFAMVEGFKADQLVLGMVPRAAAAKQRATDDEAEYWRLCREQHGNFCKLYLDRFPQGRFAPLANAIENPPKADAPPPGANAPPNTFNPALPGSGVPPPSAPAAQPSGTLSKSAAESQAVNELLKAQGNADATIQASEKLLSNFPASAFRESALLAEAEAYRSKNNPAKAQVYAERALAANPRSFQATLLVGELLAGNTRDADIDKEYKLLKAEGLLMGTIENLKTAAKPNAQLSDQQWEQSRKWITAEAHNDLGMVALLRKRYDVAISEFKTAAAGDPQPAYLVRLASAYQMSGKNGEAVALCDRLLADPQLHPQIKSVAVSIKNAATKK